MSIYPLAVNLAAQWSVSQLEEPALFRLRLARAYADDRDLQLYVSAPFLSETWRDLIRSPRFALAKNHSWRLLCACAEGLSALGTLGSRNRMAWFLAAAAVSSRIVPILRDVAEACSWERRKHFFAGWEEVDSSFLRPAWRVLSALYALRQSGYGLGKWSKRLFAIAMASYFAQLIRRRRNDQQQSSPLLTADGRHSRHAQYLLRVDDLHAVDYRSLTDRKKLFQFHHRVGRLGHEELRALRKMPLSLERDCKAALRRLADGIAQLYNELFEAEVAELTKRADYQGLKQLCQDRGVNAGLLSPDNTQTIKQLKVC